MKAIVRPETVLHCQNQDCKYSDECWRFKAFGGDDVTYKCPKCDSIAALVAINKTDEVEPVEVVDKKDASMEELIFIVGDLTKGTLRVMRGSVVEEAGLDGSDLLIPMIEFKDLEQLNPRAREDFDAQLASLSGALYDGSLPEIPEVMGWLDVFQPAKPTDTIDTVEPERKFLGVYERAFESGFQAGINFALKDLKFTIPPVKQLTEEPENPPKATKSRLSAKKKKSILTYLRKSRP